MITDEKRREVAQKLRGLPINMYSTIDEWEKDGLFINNSVCDEGDYSQIHDAVFGYFPAEYMHPGDYEELHDRLADLIDRPTCEMDECSIDHGSRSWGMRCSRCGTEFDHEKPAYGWRYCPKCGAMVVEKDGDDD